MGLLQLVQNFILRVVPLPQLLPMLKEPGISFRVKSVAEVCE